MQIINWIKNSFNQLGNFNQVANFAAAAKGKKAPVTKNAKPAKQKLMKRQKLAASKDSSAARRSVSDRTANLKEALFSVNPLREANEDQEELHRRSLIAKGWSKWTMQQQHQQSTQEHRFMQSKLRAMEELRKVSPILAEKASGIDYTAAPLTRKIAAETAPNELPFK